MFSPMDAARFFDDAHRQRATYCNLPDAIAPHTVAEAYAAQDALCALWAERLGPVAGMKIATTTKVMQQLMGIDHPCGGMIFASTIQPAPATIEKARHVNLRVECELAVRLGRDLGQGAAPHTRASVREAIADVMPAFELIEDRHAHYASCKAMSLIADNAWNAGIVIGQPMALPPALDLNGIVGSMERNGKVEAAGKTDDPLAALAWLANLAVERRQPITAGMVIITGSVIATVDIGRGEELCFTLDGIGPVSMRAA